MAAQSTHLSKDQLLQATLLSEAMQPSKLLQHMLDDMVDHLTLFFRLRRNLDLAKVQVAAMQARNQRIEELMDTQQCSGAGQQLNTVR